MVFIKPNRQSQKLVVRPENTNLTLLQNKITKIHESKIINVSLSNTKFNVKPLNNGDTHYIVSIEAYRDGTRRTESGGSWQGPVYHAKVNDSAIKVLNSLYRNAVDMKLYLQHLKGLKYPPPCSSDRLVKVYNRN